MKREKLERSGWKKEKLNIVILRKQKEFRRDLKEDLGENKTRTRGSREREKRSKSNRANSPKNGRNLKGSRGT